MSERKRCVQHDWAYPHAIWQGRVAGGAGDVGVARYCRKCRKVEAAFTNKWRPVPDTHPDMLDAPKIGNTLP